MYGILGIGGQVDMKHTCGIIVAEERARAGREDKVCNNCQVPIVYIDRKYSLRLLFLLFLIESKGLIDLHFIST